MANEEEQMADPEKIKATGSEYARDIGRRLIRQQQAKRKEKKEAEKALIAKQPQDFKESPEIANIDEDSELEDYNKALSVSINQTSHLQKLKKKAAKALATYNIMAFLMATILAVIKDLYDIGTLELDCWYDWIIDIFLGFIITVFLWGRGGTKWKTKAIKRVLITTLGEALPILGFLPFWTFMVLWAWLKAAAKKDDSLIVLRMIDKSLEEAVRIAKIYEAELAKNEKS
jgi:hypothetical protein